MVKVMSLGSSRDLVGRHQKCLKESIFELFLDALERYMLWYDPLFLVEAKACRLLALSYAHQIHLLIHSKFLHFLNEFSNILAYRLTYFLLPFFCQLPCLFRLHRFQTLLDCSCSKVVFLLLMLKVFFLFCVLQMNYAR